MGLDLERIKNTFFLYSGEDPASGGNRAELCGQLCAECAARAEKLLGKAPESEAEACVAALECWAAAEAFYQLALTEEAVTPECVSADGVEIRPGERARKAKALAEEKRRALPAALREEGVYFGRA